METYQLFEAVFGTSTYRVNSCYMEIDGVVVRIADHQANFVNFDCFNDMDSAKAVINVVITDSYLSDKEFESFLDEKNIDGIQIQVTSNDEIEDVAEYIRYEIERKK